MFAVWGWGVGINGTSSVVAVSGIFSEYMDFFYFCTCSPFKKKKEKKNLKFYVLFGDTSSGVPDPPSLFLGAVLVQPQEGRGRRLTVLLCRRAGLVHMPI